MTAASRDPAARDTAGRFRPGCSGNPAGRPLGRRSAASVLKEQLRGDQVDAAVQIIGDALAAGSEATARFVIKQIDPKKRAALVAFDYPPGASVIERFQALFAAAANGDITPEEAQALSRVLEREGNTTVKAAGVARDLEHDTRADQARAATPKADQAAADTARARRRRERDARLAEIEREAPACRTAPPADATPDSAPREDSALLKPCSISPAADGPDPDGTIAAPPAPPSPAPAIDERTRAEILAAARVGEHRLRDVVLSADVAMALRAEREPTKIRRGGPEFSLHRQATARPVARGGPRPTTVSTGRADLRRWDQRVSEQDRWQQCR